MQNSVYRRRRLTALMALIFAIGVVAYAALASGSRPADKPDNAAVRLETDGKLTATIPLRSFDLATTAGQAQLRRAVANKLPTTTVKRRGKARVTASVDQRAAATDAVALGKAGGTVKVSTTPLAATITAPVIKQKLRNNCEAAALQILMASEGVRASQEAIQSRLRRDGPLDPQGVGSSRIWGDPNIGYVGREDGGGTAGGFGVFQKPIVEVASKFRFPLTDLTGSSSSAVYDKLLSGRAVMVWLGLAEGPFQSWKSPRGKTITVNMNEHTVVLNGIDRSGQLDVVDPLTGTRRTWTKSEFEAMWERLGDRAVAS